MTSIPALKYTQEHEMILACNDPANLCSFLHTLTSLSYSEMQGMLVYFCSLVLPGWQQTGEVLGEGTVQPIRV